MAAKDGPTRRLASMRTSIRCLIAWELGSNSGHLIRSLSIAKALRERGHQVMFAVRNTRSAADILGPHRFLCMQAPLMTSPSRRNREHPPRNYSEILLQLGYRDPQALRGAVDSWLGLYHLAKPDVIVADHAPTAILSARVAQIRTVAVGNGFDIPPNVSPLPDINPWQPAANETRMALDAEVLNRINTVLHAYGRPDMKRMADLFADANPILATFKELDHYGERPDAFYAGQFYGYDEGAPATWPKGGGPRIFVHLRPHMKRFAPVMAVLRELTVPTLCVAPGLTYAEPQNLQTETLVINAKPVALESALAHADLAIGYGGIGMTTEALLAGVPQIILPEVREQALCGQRLEAIGAGICLASTRRDDHVEIANAIERVLRESEFRHAADRFVGENKGHDAETTLECISRLITGAPAPARRSAA